MTRIVLLLLSLVTYISTAATPVYGKCGTDSQYNVGSCSIGKAGLCGSPGYACDATLKQCCPTIDVADQQYWLGPSLGGMCPNGYTVVRGIPGDINGNGICIDFSSASSPQ